MERKHVTVCERMNRMRKQGEGGGLNTKINAWENGREREIKGDKSTKEGTIAEKREIHDRYK